MLPIVFNFVPNMLSSQEWQHRYAGLLCISAIAEGCVKLLEKEIVKVIKMVIPYVKDPHPRVRWALCNCIGQLSADFAVIFWF